MSPKSIKYFITRREELLFIQLNIFLRLSTTCGKNIYSIQFIGSDNIEGNSPEK